MLALSRKTGKKQTAHSIIHKCAMEAFENNIPFNEHVMRNKEILKYLTEKEIRELLTPENHLGLIQKCIDDTAGP